MSTASRYSRKSFLGRLGVGAAVAATGGVAELGAPRCAMGANSAAGGYPTTFGRIFPDLRPFAEASDDVKAGLVELAKPGGILDANDDLAAGPVRLITDPALNINNPNNATHTAGTTFFGQFVDHDTTFDTSSQLGIPTDPGTTANVRSPRFDLDSVFGAGPIASPQLYDSADPPKLRIESGGRFEDLPRTGDGVALIGDPRNDENLIISGLHCAFILFYNHAVDAVRAEQGRAEASEIHRKARELTTWHYQWLVLYEYLPQIVGRSLVDDLLARGGRFYQPKPHQAFMPVEFQGAAYRFGHSMVRPSYRANLAGDGGKAFFGLIFDPSQEGKPDPADLRGGFRAPRRFIGWQTFFDFGDGQVKPNKLIDVKLSSPLFTLPLAAIAGHNQPQVLPQRTLLRGLTWSLPSGQSIASRMGAEQVPAADLADLAQFHRSFPSSTPLFYYVLKEAEVLAGGLRLGPVGGRIVAEVLIGMMRADPEAFLVRQPRWEPTLGRRGTGFRMVDFLRFAGVDPASRGQ